MTVRHNGKEWVASGDGLEVCGRTWEELDRRLRDRLAERGAFRDAGSIRICMRFDMDGLPRRLHQYSSHYFNRVVSLSP